MTVKRRLKGRGGFSLAETMLAVLILLLVSLIVATGVPAAKNAYYKVILGSNAQAVLTTATTALRDEFSTAWDIAQDEDDTSAVTYFNPDTGMTSELALEEDGIVITEYVESGRLLDNQLKATEGDDANYEHGLLPPGALPDGMLLICDSVVYDAGNGILTFSDLQIVKDEVTLAELASFPVRVISAGSETISKPVEASSD